MLSIIAIVIGLVVGAIAIAAWLKPAPKPETPAAKVYSEQEVADAKKSVCDAFDQVKKSVTAAGGKTGDNPTDTFVVAVNIRVALTASSNYLFQTLDANSAVPKDLADPVRNLAITYRKIVMEQLADTSAA